MAGPGRRLMTRSNLALARRALALAQAALPPYSHRNSPKKFTQHRLFAILAVRQALPLDNRGAEQLLKDRSDLRQVLGMARLRQVSSAGAHAPMLFTTGNESKCHSGDLWPKGSCRVGVGGVVARPPSRK